MRERKLNYWICRAECKQINNSRHKKTNFSTPMIIKLLPLSIVFVTNGPVLAVDDKCLSTSGACLTSTYNVQTD